MQPRPFSAKTMMRTPMKTRTLLTACAALTTTLAGATAQAQAVDFNNFAISPYQNVGGFDLPGWTPDAGGTFVNEPGNSDPTFFYDANFTSTLNKRITGKINIPIATISTPDDDIFGIAIGFDNSPGFTPTGIDDSDFLLIDWKGLTQNFDWTDDTGLEGTFHDLTGATDAPEGLRAVRVLGTPTADELWGAVDLSDPGLPPGSAEQLQRGATAGAAGYAPKSSAYEFTIDYTPSNLKVWVDGVLQIDVDAPVGNAFTDGGLALYESGQSGEVTFSDFSIDAIPASTPTPSNTKVLQAIVTADNIVTGLTPGVLIEASTAPNTGDYSISSDATAISRAFGTAIVTVIGNRTGTDVVTAENESGFNHRSMGAATAPATAAGGEKNTDFGIVFVPYTQAVGGFYRPGSTDVVAPNADVTFEKGGTLDLNDQDGIFKLSITGGSSSSGFLFTVGNSNEDNVANSTAQADGSWIIGVRDNSSTQFGGAATFEDDDFSFLYLPTNMPGLIAGEVTDGSNASIGMSAGSYTLTREGTGLYRLSVDGIDANDFVLLLEATESSPTEVIGLGPSTLNTVDLPLNHYATYEVDNGDYLIQLIELGGVNAVIDGAFNFALITDATAIPGDTDGDGDVDDSDLGTSFSNYTGPGGTGKTAADGDTDGDGDVDDGDLGTSFSNYTGPLGPAVPEPTSLALLGLGGLLVARRRRD